MALPLRIAKREDVSPKEGVKKYGSGAGFADEKNKKYPLDTKEHVEAAAHYWGMPKNREKYSAADQKTITAKIEAAKKKFGVGETKSAPAGYSEEYVRAAIAELLREPRDPARLHRAFKPEILKGELAPGVVGRVAGIALVYDVVDEHGTSFDEGCLDRTRAERVANGKVKLFWDHGDVLSQGFYDSDQHIGIVRSLETISLPDGKRAEWMTADIFDSDKGREVHQYLTSVAAAGGETGLSIGMKDSRTYQGQLPSGERGTRFAEVALREISITAESSIPGTVVTAVRQASAGEPAEKQMLRFLMQHTDATHTADCIREFMAGNPRHARRIVGTWLAESPLAGDADEPDADDAGAVPDSPRQARADSPEAKRLATPEERLSALQRTYS